MKVGKAASIGRQTGSYANCRLAIREGAVRVILLGQTALTLQDGRPIYAQWQNSRPMTMRS